MNQIIIQGIGYIGLLFIIASFQINKRGQILGLLIIGVLFFVLQYLLLGAWTGVLMNSIGAVLIYVSNQKDVKPWADKKFWPYLFILLFAVAGFITSKSITDWLPVFAQILGTIAVWQKNPTIIRFLFLPPRPLWFLYNYFVGSYAGMLTEVFVFLSVIAGILRFDIKKKTLTKKNQSV